MHKFTLRDMFRLLTNVCLALAVIVWINNVGHDLKEGLLVGVFFLTCVLLAFHRLLIPRWKLECYNSCIVGLFLAIYYSDDMYTGHFIAGFIGLMAPQLLLATYLYSRRLRKEAARSEKLAGMVNPFEEHEPELESASEPLFGEIGEVGKLREEEIVVKTQFFPTSR